MTDIINPNPVIVPAQEEKVYPLFWMTNFRADSPGPGQPITVYAKLAPFRRFNVAGIAAEEVKPNAAPEEIKIVQIPDLTALIQANAKVAAAYNALTDAINEVNS